MSRVERIKELMKLHEDGAISSLELGELIKGLNDEEPSRSGASSPDSESLPPPDVQRGIASIGSQNAGAESPTVVENNKSSRLRIVAVFAVLLVAVAVFVLTRKGDPTESQEYQKLHGGLQKKWFVYKSMGIHDGEYEQRQWLVEQVNSGWDFMGGGFGETDTFGSASPQSLLTFNDEAEGPCKTAWRRGLEDWNDECRSPSRMQLKKNPEQYKGECIRGSIRIAQYDSNTGPCSFQGYFGGGYDVRVQVGTTLDTATHATAKECDWFDELVEDKYIEVWAFVLGSYQYSTTSGGNQTVPALRLVAWR
jgi:hypothetical protein